MKLLIENWRKFLTEISAEEIKWFGPAFAKIAEDPSVLGYTKWIEQNVGPWMGSGYSRAAYAIKGRPELVFKIAEDELDDGRYTNGEEKKFFNKYPEFFPRVWMTSEHMDRDPHMRMGGSPRKDNVYLDWIIVDRVRPLEDAGDVDEFLGKKFRILDEIIAKTPWRKGSDGQIALPISFRMRLFEFFLRSFEENRPTHRFGLGGLRPFLDRQLSLKETDDIIESIFDVMIKDSSLAKLTEVVHAAGMRTDEIRSENIGTDIKTGTKLILLDINRFLYKHGKEGE